MTRGLPVQADSARGTPAGAVVVAVGDIHGRLDLLEVAIDQLDALARSMPVDQKFTAVFLGDYIDRGAESKGVVARLIELRRSAPWEVVFLRGNHEQFLLDMIDGVAEGTAWLDYGGVETLRSYGIDWPPPAGGRAAERLGERLRQAVPAEHVRFLRETGLCLELGDYIFVHAGLRPDRLLSEQSDADKMWFRYYADEEPLHGRTVVHGHTPRSRPVLGRWRIGIDTGAYDSGELTLLRLEGAEIKFLRVTLSGAVEWPAIDRPHDRHDTVKSPSREALSVEFLSLGAVKSARLVAMAAIALVGVLVGVAWLLAGRSAPPREAVALSAPPVAPVPPVTALSASLAPPPATLPAGDDAPPSIAALHPSPVRRQAQTTSPAPAFDHSSGIVNLATAAAPAPQIAAVAPTLASHPSTKIAPPPEASLANDDGPIATAATGPSG